MIALLLLFLLSGFSALVYELIWVRHAGLIFGNTVYATSTVVATYMAGLGFGAWWFGRRVARRRIRPVRLFAFLELAVAAYALAMPFLFQIITHLYVGFSRHVTDQPAALTLIRFLLSVSILIVPTFLMGGSLPVLSAALIRKDASFGKYLGWLYGINTLGAAGGLLLSGFVLIPALGLRWTNYAAVSLDSFVALTAFVLAGWMAIEPTSPAATETSNTPKVPVMPLMAVAFSGFLALALEVVWFRVLILIFGSTTYSFAAMLAVFLFGLAVGPLAFGWVADHIKHKALLFAAVLLAMAGYTLWSMGHFDDQAIFLLAYMVAHDFSWSHMIVAKFMITLFFLAFPALCFGWLFPLASRMAEEVVHRPSSAVGAAYAANTIGAIVGSLLAGFFLLPQYGVNLSLLILTVCAIVGALLLGVAQQGDFRARVAVLAVSLLLLGWTLVLPPQWSDRLLSSGPYFHPRSYVQDGRVLFREKLDAQRLLFFEEGPLASVAVVLTDSQRMQYVSDGKVEADNSPRSMLLQRMMGHLPMLFHPNPRSVLNIGLGAGVTYGALGCYDLDRMDVVEIEPAAVDVARIWAPLNHNILNHPLANVIIGDGRNFLLCTTNRYDIITSDPFEPVHAGANFLYTVDHFQVARDRLKTDGIMCQYLPLYELSREDYAGIIRSFLHVFPNTAFFYTGDDSILLGFNGPIAHRPDVLLQRFKRPAVQASLSEIGFTRPAALLGMLVADLNDVPEDFLQGRLNTDDHPRVEYSAPKNALRSTVDENALVLRKLFTDLPRDYLARVDDEIAESILNQRQALQGLIAAAVARSNNNVEEAYGLMAEAHALAPTHPIINSELADANIVFGGLRLEQGQFQEAFQCYMKALQHDPGQFEAMYQLVYLSMQNGQTELAGNILQHALKVYPGAAVFHALQGKYLATMGALDESYRAYRRAVEIDDTKAAYFRDLASVADRLGRTGEADLARKKAADL